jgi:hypothetical protein
VVYGTILERLRRETYRRFESYRFRVIDWLIDYSYRVTLPFEIAWHYISTVIVRGAVNLRTGVSRLRTRTDRSVRKRS